jgi:hypothetical protein
MSRGDVLHLPYENLREVREMPARSLLLVKKQSNSSHDVYSCSLGWQSEECFIQDGEALTSSLWQWNI